MPQPEQNRKDSVVLLIDCPERKGRMARGRELERIVLSRAECWRLDLRILCYRNTTTVLN